MAGILSENFGSLPAPLNEAAAREELAELAETGHPLAALARDDERVRNLLLAVFGASPFLTRLIRAEPEFAAACFSAEPDALFARVLEETESAAGSTSRAEAMRALRIARRRVALLLALADIARFWPLMDITRRLTDFADAAVRAALAFLLKQAEARGQLAHADAAECGLAVFAMGKMGARELNYSSDIDLIFFFDPERTPLKSGDPGSFWVRLVRQLVSMLSEMTGEGQVFRVDLRLRPDPGATAVAISTEAALNYYFSIGQTWERSAWIKARPCAGDITVGEQFMAELSPWLWRKYLDFAAIAEVHALKRQIHAVKGHGEITVPGHNLKLGRGGIREIEFFVQTQQLIAGGRNPALRRRQTLPMLDALAEHGWITQDVANDLKAAYVRLRTWEHRLQMQNDLQTHTLPKDEEELARYARFAGFARLEDFTREARQTMRTVQRHYDALFEEATELAPEEEELILAGLAADEPDEATLATLRRLGFGRPEEVLATIRGWLQGRYPALRFAGAQERLRAILPMLLKTLGESGQAEAGLAAFDRFLAGLPGGVQLFALLQANPHLMELLLRILTAAPLLAAELTRRPRLFAALIEGDLTGPLPTRAQHAQGLKRLAPLDLPFDEVLDRARIYVSEQKFIIGTRLIAETATVEEAEAAYTALAEAALAHMLAATHREMTERHGEVPGSRSAILAMGKLGSAEMTHTSDLDLIVIHDFPSEETSSRPTPAQEEQGARIRPLSPSEWFSRLTRRLITALTAPTAEGVLYEVDMRLRPSGSQGPVATHIESFRRYQAGQAWMWEHLALTRARPVAGDADLREEVARIIRETLTRPRAFRDVRGAVLDMRLRILTEKKAKTPWQVKTREGGLIDIEFIAQGLQLLHAAETPDVLRTNTARALRTLETAGALRAEHAHALAEALTLYHHVLHITRLCLPAGELAEEEKLPAAVARLLARAAKAPDIARARLALEETQARTAAIFTEIWQADTAAPEMA